MRGFLSILLAGRRPPNLRQFPAIQPDAPATRAFINHHWLIRSKLVLHHHDAHALGARTPIGDDDRIGIDLDGEQRISQVLMPFVDPMNLEIIEPDSATRTAGVDNQSFNPQGDQLSTTRRTNHKCAKASRSRLRKSTGGPCAKVQMTGGIWDSGGFKQAGMARDGD
jgi:hypothetical protein